MFPKELTILTPRLSITAPRLIDAEVINSAVVGSIKELATWMAWASPTPSLQDSIDNVHRNIREQASGESMALLVWCRDSGRLLGSSGFHNAKWDVGSIETGYWLKTDEVGKGYMLETSNALTRYAFEELAVERLVITCDEDNLRSKAIPERLGFRLDEVIKNHIKKVGSDSMRNTSVYSRVDIVGLPELLVSW